MSVEKVSNVIQLLTNNTKVLFSYLMSKSIELHWFCDASKNGYADVIYTVSRENKRQIVHSLYQKLRWRPSKR